MVRKGMGKGQGKGYKNMIGKDKVVHSQSAKGFKQPQLFPHAIEKFNKNAKIFKGSSPIPYIKKGWKKSGNFKAVLHLPNKQIIAYTKLSDLQREHPEFNNLTRAYVDLGSFKDEIWIPKKKTFTSQFKIVNDNTVKFQNWRNDIITEYGMKGYDVVTLTKFIDNNLLPKYYKYVNQSYDDSLLDTSIPKVDKALLKSLDTKMSVKFPPLLKKEYR